MAYRSDPPTIALDALAWEPNGTENGPRAALLAHIRIGSLDMHLEAWEVEDFDAGNGIRVQMATDDSNRDTDLQALAGMMDSGFQTIAIDGRTYVLVATPYGR